MVRAVVFASPWGAPRLFHNLAGALGAGIEARFKDWTFDVSAPAAKDWTPVLEAERLLAYADAEGLTRFDYIAFSGAAAVGLAFALLAPARLASLTLVEPPWIGNDLWSDDERQFCAGYRALLDHPPRALVAAFHELFSPGRGWPVSRHETEVERFALLLQVVWRGYQATALPRDRLRELGLPVYLPLGGDSSPRMLSAARCLREYLPQAVIEVIPGQHHFNVLPNAAERIAGTLRRLWTADA